MIYWNLHYIFDLEMSWTRVKVFSSDEVLDKGLKVRTRLGWVSLICVDGDERSDKVKFVLSWCKAM